MPATRARADFFIAQLQHKQLNPSHAADAAPMTARMTAAAPAAPVRTVACMVTHGMGQQVPFETCASIAEAFDRGGETPASVQANRVQLTTGGPVLARMEVVFAAAGGQPETHVHIYEGYWAPLTEGRISATRTLLFLFGAAGRCIASCFRRAPAGTGEKSTFARWVFGELRDFGIKPHTAALLVWAAVFIALGVVAAVWTEQALHHLWSAIAANFRDSTGFWQGLAALAHRFGQHWGWSLLRLAGLGVAATYAYYARYFLVEFVGDVVIYVSSYTVSEFQEIRDAIQKRVLEVGKQITAAKTDNGKTALYERLIFVGHSLGSVITYDLVNALIVWDATECHPPHDFQKRLSTLITFGSPLDKTAFLFRSQVSPEHHFREAMAGTMQPLILDYSFRTFPWINLHSHWDPVSGALAFYDWPQATGAQNEVQNKIDPDARVPAYAHVQYWKNPLLTQELRAALLR